MLFLLSPAKALDYDSPLPSGLAHSQPHFIPEAAALIAVMRQQAPQQVAQLMAISDKLAALNVARYASWTPEHSSANARQALLAFNGDVYEGLNAASLSAADLDWAQHHVAILSGLYGVLRPLDWLQAYRLEMGTKLPTSAGSNLYQYWGSRIAQYLNQRLQADAAPVIVNLASQEYFKSVDLKTLQARVVECVFEDYKDGKYKIISFYAKRARGLMSRFVIRNRIDAVEGLKAFDGEGYAFAPEASEADRLVFRRREG